MLAIHGKRFIEDYFKTINGKEKTNSLIEKFVLDKELKSNLLYFEKAFPKFEFLPREIVCEDDTIAVYAKMKGVHKGTFENFKPTNKTVQLPVSLFYKVKDEKIVKHKMFFDRMSMMEQIGAVPKFNLN